MVLRLCREDGHKKLLAQVNVWQSAQLTAPRVFCGIFTHQLNHATKVKVSQHRWKACGSNGKHLTAFLRGRIPLCVTHKWISSSSVLAVSASPARRWSQQSALNCLRYEFGVFQCQAFSQCHWLLAHGGFRSNQHTDAKRAEKVRRVRSYALDRLVSYV